MKKTFFLILIFFCFKSGKNKEKNDLASWSAFIKSLDRTYPKGWPKWPSKLFILLVLIYFVFIGPNHCLAFWPFLLMQEQNKKQFCGCMNKTKAMLSMPEQNEEFFFHLNICLTTKLSPSGEPVCQKKVSQTIFSPFQTVLDECLRVISFKNSHTSHAFTVSRLLIPLIGLYV